MMNDVDASTINSLFSQAVSDPQELPKLAEAAGAFIRQKLREVSFARKILPPVSVTKADCQRSEDHDGLVKIIDIEPDSKAMAINWRSEPDGKYVEGKRYTIPFSTISSEKFEKTEQELLAYEMPITRVIEENSVKDIQKIEDLRFLQYIEAAITASTLSATVTDTTVTRAALSQLAKLLPGKEIRLGTILMHEIDFADILTWEAKDIGGKIAAEITIDGYRYQSVLGYKLVTSIKNGVVPQGTIYGFAEPQFLGNFFMLNQTKFWIDKRANMISWQAWEDVGLGIGNINGACKIELSTGS
jgi:hypothetical protein